MQVVYLVKKNYCYVCCVGVIYDSQKIEALTKISNVINHYFEIKKDIQLCTDFDPKCDKFWLYHYKTSLKNSFAQCDWTYLINYCNEYRFLAKV